MQGFDPLRQTCPTIALPSGTPSTDQVTVVSAELATVAANDWRWPGDNVAEPGVTSTVMSLVIVTVADTEAAPPPVMALAVAWMITVLFAGSSAGAVYSAAVALVDAMVPTTELPPAIPLTSHEMLAPEAKQKVAVNVCICPSGTLAVDGETALVVPHEIVTLALADFVASATLVAVTVTVDGVGTLAGAV